MSNSAGDSKPMDLSGIDPDEIVGGFAKHLGLEITEVSTERVEGRWAAGSHLTDEAGMLHRGVHSSVIETLASIAAAVWFGDRGQVVGVNNNADYFGQSPEATDFVSTATPIHRDHDQQLWQVETVDADGTRVACGQVRLQNLYTRG